MRKIVAMIGVPGTGKSTLTKAWMKQFSPVWKREEPAKLVVAEHSVEKNTYVLGKYDEGETFPGTDRLSMAVQPAAIEWIKSDTGANIFFEGDRLGTQSFCEFLADLPDTEFSILHLEADERTLDVRYKQRGSDQSEQFLRGRQTKIEGIGRNFVLMDYITRFQHETPADTLKAIDWLNERFS